MNERMNECEFDVKGQFSVSKISTVAERLCDIGANEIELFRDSDCEGRFATGVSGLEFTLLIL